VENEELEGVTGGTVVSQSDFVGDPSAAFVTVLLTADLGGDCVPGCGRRRII
jgi:hypothetical protein